MSWISDFFSGGVFGGSSGDPNYLTNTINAANNARMTNLKNSIVTDKELDQFTSAELLRELSLQGTGFQGVMSLDQIEGTLARAKTSQESIYVNRRAESNRLKDLTTAPGLAAQTILTQNINGNSTMQSPLSNTPLISKGMPSGSGSLLT